MIYFTEGDIFLTKCEAIGHGCNLKGTMGKGIALTMRNEYPEMYKIYKSLCVNNRLCGGMNYIHQAWNKIIVNMITQDGYYNAKMEYIESCCLKIINNDYNINSIALPKIGCGLGRLKWEDVSQLLKDIFSDNKSFICVIYENYIPYNIGKVEHEIFI